MADLINLDAVAINSDWTKSSWDIPADNVEELRAYLKAAGMTPEHFRELPAYLLAVEHPSMAWLKDL